MTTPTIRQLVLARRDDERPGVACVDGSWSWAEHVAEASRLAHWLLARELEAPGHVGVLLDNVPTYSAVLAAGGLAGIPIVGLNPTRTGDAFARDVTHTSCRLLVTSSAHRAHLTGLAGLPPVVEVDDAAWRADVATQDPTPPDVDVAPDDTFVLVLTSGTTGDPKAVVCSQGKIASQGSTIVEMLQLTAEDVVYGSMPLFHSNAIIVAWTPAFASGATLALRDRFSASGFLDDVRRFGATFANYVGTPLSYVLATPERPDDADNPLRVVFGNEASPRDVAGFAERFGCRVIEAYGSTEGGIGVGRTPDTPPGALGRPRGDVRVLDPVSGEECPVATFDDEGRLTNAEDCVGELVGMDGRGAFEGYWDDDEAEADRLRDGRYWSGDLAFRDAEGFLWFAGRSGSWLRVGGENVAVSPIERILLRHPGVVEVAVHGVADPVAGDQVVASLGVTDPDGFDPTAFAAWLDGQPDLGPTWSPRWLRVRANLPHTGTNKLDRARLVREGIDGDGVLVRAGSTFRTVTTADRASRRDDFVAAGRDHLLPSRDAASAVIDSDDDRETTHA